VGTDAGGVVRRGGASGPVVFSSAGPAEGVPPRGAQEARNVLSRRRGRAVAGLAEPVAALAGAVGEASGRLRQRHALAGAGEARGEVIVAAGRGRRSLPLGEVMGAILPAPISGKLPGAAFSHSFLIEPFQGMCCRATVKSENRKPARRARGNRRRPVLLQTLSTRDFDELAGAFPRWGLRFRQLGRGPFRGHLQFLRLGGRKKRDSVK
jgi:hypothetical protein